VSQQPVFHGERYYRPDMAELKRRILEELPYMDFETTLE
jgi:hypothetical protein